MSTLLSHGLDIEIKDNSGDTAVRVAEIYSQKVCLKVIEDFLMKVKEEPTLTDDGAIVKLPTNPVVNISEEPG